MCVLRLLHLIARGKMRCSLSSHSTISEIFVCQQEITCAAPNQDQRWGQVANALLFRCVLWLTIFMLYFNIYYLFIFSLVLFPSPPQQLAGLLLRPMSMDPGILDLAVCPCSHIIFIFIYNFFLQALYHQQLEGRVQYQEVSILECKFHLPLPTYACFVQQ